MSMARVPMCQQFLAVMEEPAWLMAPDSDVVHCNESFCGAVGRVVQAPGETRLKDIFCDDSVAAVHAAIRGMLDNDEDRGLIEKVKAGKDCGGYAAMLQMVRDPSGHILIVGKLGVEGMSELGSDAGTIQSRLRAQNEVLRFATSISNIAVWSMNPRTKMIDVTNNFYEVLGFKPGEVEVHSHWIRNRIHPDDLEAALQLGRDMASGRVDSYCVDCRLQMKDGSWKWFQNAARINRSAVPGEPEIVCGTIMDVSMRRREQEQLAVALSEAESARTQLAESETAHRVSTESADIAPWHFDSETGEAWWSDHFYRLLGYEVGGFAGRREAFLELIHPDDSPASASAIQATEDGQANVHRAQYRLRNKDGSWHWYESVARPVSREAQGKPPLICGSMRCIDDLKENERQLAESVQAAEQARDRLNSLADNAPGALFEVARDEKGDLQLSYFSAKLPKLMGVRESDCHTSLLRAVRNVNPADLEDFQEKVDISEKDLTPFEWHFRVRSGDGSERWIYASSLPQKQADGSVIWFGNLADVTENKDMERKALKAARSAEQARARLSSVADNAPAGMFELKYRQDEPPRLAYASARFREIFGLVETDCGDAYERMVQAVTSADRDGFTTSLNKAREDLTHWSHRFRVMHEDLGQRWISGSATPRVLGDGSTVLVGTYHDVTNDVEREVELKRAHEMAETIRAENERQALHDPLTGLPNRRFFDVRIAERFKAAKAEKQKTGCVLVRMDVDRFKYVNDTLGHEAGDEVLKNIAWILAQTASPSDFPSRIGGDEFSILLAPDATEAEAQDLVTRIQKGLSQPLNIDGRNCVTEASFGIAYVDDLTQTGSDILPFADAALYRAKEKGRNRMQLFTPELKAEMLNDRRIASELQDALAHDQFVPFFQPQIDARSGDLVGVETLLRWNHPERGMLTPDNFLEVAEQLRIVPTLDRIMMEKARASLKRLNARGVAIPKISFNVSSGRIMDADLIVGAKAIIDEGTNVTFELLESILVEEESDVFKFQMDRIREVGIDIEIDDFGSGHASIIGVLAISPSALKIDKRIIAPVHQDIKSRRLVRAIVEIAETLGIVTIAEGVAKLEQVEALQEIGCDILQGFYFARPVGEADLASFIRMSKVSDLPSRTAS